MFSTLATVLLALTLTTPAAAPQPGCSERLGATTELKDPFAPSPAEPAENSRARREAPRDLIDPFEPVRLSDLPAPSQASRGGLPGLED